MGSMAAARAKRLRNPLSGFAITILGAAGLSVLMSIVILLLPPLILPVPRELLAIILAFVLFAMGVVAGRASLLGFMGFVGAFVGGFVGTLIVQYVAWPTGWEFLLALGFGATTGLGGLVTGKLGIRRGEQAVRHMPQSRRCMRCGARVGLTATKCWSCRAYLPL